MRPRPIGERPTDVVTVRGSEAMTRGLSGQDEAAMIGDIMRRFYPPLNNQARWIDPRPLAHQRNDAADSAMKADEDWSDMIVEATNLRRVCPLGGPDDNCKGKPGGVMRFSNAYAVRGSKDTALVFATYRPLQAGVESEIEFFMIRGSDGWRIDTKRSLERATVVQSPQTQQSVAEELLITDRAFGIDAARTDLVSAITAQFDDSVIMQNGGAPTFARGKAAAIVALRANPDNPRSRTTWAPIRVGISADGRHGFSYGYMTLIRPDSSRVPLKYLAYWVKTPAGWRVAAYKRRGRPAGEVSAAMLEPALPMRLVAPITDAATIAGHRATLMAAEKEFSDTAQTIGIGAAFERYGRRADAMNMGGPNDTAFVIGSPAVGRSVGAGSPGGGSPVSWASDYHAIVASSGDLGVTFGFIRPNTAPAAGQPTAFQFFTIWKRDPGGRWLYIAE